MYKIQMFPILEMLETTIVCHWTLIRFTDSRQQQCVCVCRGVRVCTHTPATMQMWRSEDNL